MTPHDVWAEIDLKSISHNIKAIKSILASKTGLMAVVKANAYGHGVLEVTEQALSAGASALGVARISEAIQIREGSFDAPILIFGHTPQALAGKLIDYDLTQALWSYETADILSRIARSGNTKIKVHINIDTGMGRLGILPCDLTRPYEPGHILKDAVKTVEAIHRLPGIEVEGIYTHFASADEADKTSAIRQLEIFTEFLTQLKQRGIEFKIKHAANSAAIIDMPETHLDMVRAGIAIYGYYPSRSVDTRKISLRPALTLKSRIIHLKKVGAGFKVSYGSTEETAHPTAIATVSVGYADGYSRRLSSKGKMMIGDRLAPVIGRVCMDQTMLNVGHLPDVRVGDDVVVLGSMKNSPIAVDEIANSLNTISYEVLTNISHRVAREYLR
ncbi:MAG: alanine racemase [Desulfosalsimonadaceae bacterium]